MKIKLHKTGDEKVSIRVARRIPAAHPANEKLSYELYICQVAYDTVRRWFAGDFYGLSEIVKIEITDPITQLISQDSVEIGVGDNVKIRISI